MKSYLAEVFVHVQYFICNLSACDHGSLPDFLKDRSTQEHKLLVLLVILIVRVLITLSGSLSLSFSNHILVKIL